MKSQALENKIGIVARTHVGMVRQNNEDYHGYSVNITQDDWHFYEETIVDKLNQPLLLVVADGMGGLEMGEEASRIAVETTRKYARENSLSIIRAQDGEVIKHFNNLFASANDAILDFARKNGKIGEIGTTLIVAYIVNNQAHIFWIGDSRCYLFRNGKLKLLSKDHSYVQELVDQGKITYEQAFYHPDSNIITKFIGDPESTPVPSYTNIYLEDGDVLMLCSDGLNGMLEDVVIEQHFYQFDDLIDLCQALINSANEAGGNDNTTIILASIGNFVHYRPTSIVPARVSTTFPDPITPYQNYGKNKPLKSINWKVAILSFLLGSVFTMAVFFLIHNIMNNNDNNTEIKKPIETENTLEDTVLNQSFSPSNSVKSEDTTRVEPKASDKSGQNGKSVQSEKTGQSKKISPGEKRKEETWK